MKNPKTKIKFSIVIPCFNDQEPTVKFVNSLVQGFIEKKQASYQIIIVDDGSTEGGYLYLEKSLKKFENVNIVRLKRNFGQQIALYVGLTFTSGEVVVTVDGDGQYRSDSVFAMLAAVTENYQLVSGIRENRKDNLVGILTSKVGSLFIRKFLGIAIVDFGSIKAFSKKLVIDIVNARKSDPDVYGSALVLQPQITEIYVKHHTRTKGSSRWSLSKRLKMYFDLYMRTPTDDFGLLFHFGLFIVTISILATCYIIFHKYAFGHGDSVFSILSLGAIFFLAGFQFIVWAFISILFRRLLQLEPKSLRDIVSEKIR